MGTILMVIVGVGLAMYCFFRFYLPFGGKTPRAVKRRSPQFVGSKFINQIPTPMNLSLASLPTLMRKQLARDSLRRPARPVIARTFKPVQSATPQITWFGHSTFLLQLEGKTILLDPIFSRSPSPFQTLGPQRFTSLAVTIAELPTIDMVVISHDHYDHLDYGSIRQLVSKTTTFLVPLGLAAHLRRWGVSDKQIVELDWWDERNLGGFKFACTPARHFSGRTLTDRFTTLWCSWVIDSGKTKVFFSGDSGYGPHFKQIGKQYGPFDLTLLECGQYDPLWPNIHMMPEQTAQAHSDLRGKRMIPMHWGAFVLAFHSWTDPVERVLAAGAKTGATIITPELGETVAFTAKHTPAYAWWEDADNK